MRTETDFALDEDQLVLTAALKTYITDTLGIEFELLYQVCPLVLSWVYGQHWDAVTHNWPKTIVFVHPPKRLTRFCFIKALCHFQSGYDAVVLVQDSEIKHLLDDRVALACSIYDHLGKPVFEPWSTPKGSGFSLYFMLTPRTVNNILRLRGKGGCQPNANDEFLRRKNIFETTRKLDKAQCALRLFMTGAINKRVTTFLKIKNKSLA